MVSVIPTPISIKSMDVQARLKRGIGIHLAMKEAAHLLRNREGQSFESLKTLPAEEKAFLQQLVEKVVAKFEEGAFDKQPETPEETRRQEREAYLLIERQTARLHAGARGHDMGPWGNVEGRFDETSACIRCSRIAVLAVTYGPEIQIQRHGSALTEGCLTIAPEVA